jgi:hypothetical protein
MSTYPAWMHPHRIYRYGIFSIPETTTSSQGTLDTTEGKTHTRGYLERLSDVEPMYIWHVVLLLTIIMLSFP